MIESNKGNVHIRGNLIDIYADLATLVHSLYFQILIEKEGMKPEKARADIMEAVENGMRTEEEIEREAEGLHDSFDELLGAIEKFLKKAGER